MCLHLTENLCGPQGLGLALRPRVLVGSRGHLSQPAHTHTKGTPPFMSAPIAVRGKMRRARWLTLR